MKIADIILLAKLFCSKENKLLFYTNQNISSTKEVQIFNSENDIVAFLAQNQHQNYVVFSEKKDVKLLFSTKNISNTFQFHQQIDSENTDFKSKKFHYINNRDKTIRWIFPSNSKTPTFLSLYNSAGWKAKLYKSLIHASFFFKLQKLFLSNSFTFFYKKEYVFDEILPNEYADFSIFTGTVGANRKMLIAIQNKNNISHFLKFPTSDKAEKLLQNEHQQLNFLQQFEFQSFTIPSVQQREKGILLSNIKPKNTQKNIDLNDKHLKALDEIYEKTIENINFSNSDISKEIEANLLKISKIKYTINSLSIEKIQQLSQNLQELYTKLKMCKNINVTLAHKDFTPWNMYADHNKLYVYDWELAAEKTPLLFDAFHFIFQSNILIKRQDYKYIKLEIDKLKQMNYSKNMCRKYDIHFNFYLLFYIVYIAAYYLNLYVKQKHLHLQAHWLIDAWTAATQDFIDNKCQALFIVHSDLC